MFYLCDFHDHPTRPQWRWPGRRSTQSTTAWWNARSSCSSQCKRRSRRRKRVSGWKKSRKRWRKGGRGGRRKSSDANKRKMTEDCKLMELQYKQCETLHFSSAWKKISSLNILEKQRWSWRGSKKRRIEKRGRRKRKSCRFGPPSILCCNEIMKKWKGI